MSRPKPSEIQISLSLRLPASLVERIKAIAEKETCSVSRIALLALREYADKVEAENVQAR